MRENVVSASSRYHTDFDVDLGAGFAAVRTGVILKEK
jgi:hypothetical protein